MQPIITGLFGKSIGQSNVAQCLAGTGSKTSNRLEHGAVSQSAFMASFVELCYIQRIGQSRTDCVEVSRRWFARRVLGDKLSRGVDSPQSVVLIFLLIQAVDLKSERP